MNLKIAAIGAAVAALVLFGGVTSCQRGNAAQEAVRSYQTAQKVDAKVASKAEKRAQARIVVEAQEDRAVAEAVQSAPEWAAQPVPADVLAALRQ